jgi:hypothetical protein
VAVAFGVVVVTERGPAFISRVAEGAFRIEWDGLARADIVAFAGKQKSRGLTA